MKSLFIWCTSLALILAPVQVYAKKKGANVYPKTAPYSYVSPQDSGKTAQAEAARAGKLMMRVLFLGSVSQGIHYFPEKTDLLTCLMYAGGYDETAQLNGIQIRRKGVADLIEIDLEDLIEDGDPIPALKDGDIVNVDWNWRKDLQLYYTITGFLASVTAFTLSVIALTK